MTALRWLGVSLAVGIAAAAFTSCKGSTAATSTAGSGSGGAGGSSVTTGTGGKAGDGGPILCPQQYTNITKTGPCDLLDQNCPPGKTCEPAQDSNNGFTTACISAGGLKTAGKACYSAAECDDKLICIGQSATHPGQCVAFCCPSQPYEPCNGGICNERVNFGGGNFAYVCSYGQRCTLLTAGACPPGYHCYVESAAGQGIAVCLEPSPTMVGELETCNFINDCASMQDCFGLASGSGVCLYYCALTGPTMTAAPGLGGCPTGEKCQDTYQGQPVATGVSGVGLCIPDGGIVPKTDGGAGDAGHDAGAGFDGGHDGGAGHDAGDGG